MSVTVNANLTGIPSGGSSGTFDSGISATVDGTGDIGTSDSAGRFNIAYLKTALRVGTSTAFAWLFAGSFPSLRLRNATAAKNKDLYAYTDGNLYLADESDGDLITLGTKAASGFRVRVQGTNPHMLCDSAATGHLGSSVDAWTSAHLKGAVHTQPVTVAVTGDDQSITTTNRGLILLTSDNATAANRTIILGDGQSGQVLTLVFMTDPASGKIELPNSTANNVRLTADWTIAGGTIGQYSSITLFWNNSDSNWIEISRNNKA